MPHAGTSFACCTPLTRRWRRPSSPSSATAHSRRCSTSARAQDASWRFLRAALSPRGRHRPVARDAGGGPRQSRQSRRVACAGAAGGPLRAAGRARMPSISSPCIRSCTISTIRGAAIREAARLLRPGGRLVIVDFAPHALEFLRARACASAPRLLRSPDRRLAGRIGPRSRRHTRLRAGCRGRETHREDVAGARPQDADRRPAQRCPRKEKQSDEPVSVSPADPDIGDKIRVSFEFFPPKSDEMEARLWETVTRLAPLRPNFVSVHQWGRRLHPRAHRAHRQANDRRDETNPRGAHDLRRRLACRGPTGDPRVRGARRQAVRGAARRSPAASARATSRILKDMPMAPTGRRDAPHRRVDISVSAYPEKHPESPDFATDIDMLKRKVDNGATRAITQFFFDNDLYERYVERVRRAGFYIPVVPGILPVHNFSSGGQFLVPLRHACPRLAGRALRRAARRSADALRWSPPPSPPSRSWTSSSGASSISTSIR